MAVLVKQREDAGDARDEAAERKYTELYLNGLELGFTASELRTMQFQRLAGFLSVKGDSLARASKAAGDGGKKKATQKDIESFFG